VLKGVLYMCAEKERGLHSLSELKRRIKEVIPGINHNIASVALIVVSHIMITFIQDLQSQLETVAQTDQSTIQLYVPS